MTAVEILCSRLCRSNHLCRDGAGTKSVCVQAAVAKAVSNDARVIE